MKNSPSSPTSSPTSASRTGSPASSGRLDFTSAADLDRLCPDWRQRAAYACGPEGFLNDAEALWEAEAGGRPAGPSAAAGTLTIERFSTSLAGGAGHDGGLVTFEASDREVEADGDTPLLDVGEDAGILMPSGCRMGICHSCLIPLRAGHVRDLRTGRSARRARPTNPDVRVGSRRPR